MKLALIRHSYTDFGGAERYVGQLARRLVGAGHEVHILAKKWQADPQSGIRLHRLKSLGGPAWLRLESFARAAAEAVDRGGYDLVHSFERTACQDIYRAGDGCHREWLDRRARALGPGRARLDRINPRHRAFLRMEAKLFGHDRLKIVLANSQAGRDEILRHYGLPEDRVRVVFNGLDREKYHPGLAAEHREAVRRELNLDPDEPLVLFVGSGFQRKGLGELIQALAGARLGLLVVGQDRIGQYQQLADRLGLGGRVRFLGPRRDVERLLGAADAFCLPSWYEPFSNACLEAMAAGLPLVVTRETGAAEVIEEGVNGFSVGFPVDPEELGDRLERAVGLDREMLNRANDRVLERFDWERNTAATLAAYDELAGRG